ncbi:hypothetical protein [Enterococcus casseliflavus]|uniref:hypothetical protein n=1 Tax=Enterococcus casseliflavus TaxID=37734 RepID=UPI003DA3E679
MPIKDLTGRRFGRLTVIEDSGARSHQGVFWLCRCDCGSNSKVSTNNLKGGRVESCGCLFDEFLQKQLESDCVEGTRLQALMQKKNSNNTSGVTGVSWHKAKKKWMACIIFKGRRHHLGCFSDKQDGINARKEAEEKYFKPMLEKYGRGKNE